MMDYKSQLKLQAYLDGELAEGEAREVAGWLARDREAVALLAELKMTRQAMADFETGIKLPESREFFWSKIERQLQASEAVEPARGVSPLLAAWRRFLAPATGLAAVLMVTVLLVRGSGNPDAESSMSDPGAFTYRDYKNGTTLVWLSYPAEELAENEAPANAN
jgi:anti-sigma factor RsiW